MINHSILGHPWAQTKPSGSCWIEAIAIARITEKVCRICGRHVASCLSAQTSSYLWRIRCGNGFRPSCAADRYILDGKIGVFCWDFRLVLASRGSRVFSVEYLNESWCSSFFRPPAVGFGQCRIRASRLEGCSRCLIAKIHLVQGIIAFVNRLPDSYVAKESLQSSHLGTHGRQHFYSCFCAVCQGSEKLILFVSFLLSLRGLLSVRRLTVSPYGFSRFPS